jgi:methylmalonyl-CoA/ethylmalonyl-CoA epimerase
MSEAEMGGPLVKLGEIGQIALTVRDLAKAKAFYKDVLGLMFLFDAGTMVFFQCGSVRLLLGLPEGKVEDAPANVGTILYFKVAELKATFDALKGAGVAVVQEPNMVARMPDHELWLAAFKDPEGNVIELMSELRPEAAKKG